MFYWFMVLQPVRGQTALGWFIIINNNNNKLTARCVASRGKKRRLTRPQRRDSAGN